MKMQWLILVVVAMMFTTACSGGGDNSAKNRAFIGGTLGVLPTFMAEEPPAEVTSSNYPFSVTVQLVNKGEWEVPASKAYVTLKGIDARDFGTTQSALTDQHPDSDLAKNEINTDTGEIIESTPAYATFKLQYSNPIVGNHEFPFVVDTCYEYGTKATAEMCVKEKLLDSKNLKVCTVTGSKPLENSGGPIQLTQFLEYTSGADAVRFTMTISKVGSGEVAKKGSKCSTESNNKDYVHMKITTDLEGSLTCAGFDGREADLKLINGMKQVTCTQKLSGNDKVDKVKLANVEITYDYLESISTKVLVKQVTE